MPGEQVRAATGRDRRSVTGPRHAAPRKSLLARLQVPAGKAIALAAMPSAVLMGMGLTPRFAEADELPKNGFAPGKCVSAPDKPAEDKKRSADPNPSASPSTSPSVGSSASPSATPATIPSAASGDDERAAREQDAQDTQTRAGNRPGEQRQQADKRGGGAGDAKGGLGWDDAEAGGADDAAGSEWPRYGGLSGAQHQQEQQPGLLDPIIGPIMDFFDGLGGGEATADRGPRADGPGPEQDRPDAEPSSPGRGGKDVEDGGKDGDGSKDGEHGKSEGGKESRAKESRGNEPAAERRGAGRTGGPFSQKGRGEERRAAEAELSASPSPSAAAKRQGAEDGRNDREAKDAGSPQPYATDAQGRALFPCPEAQKVAGENEQTPHVLPDQPWTLKSTLLALHGLDYQGVVNLRTAGGGTKQALKFTVGSIDIGDLHQLVDGPDGLMYHVAAREGTTSTIRKGTVTMYTERLEGKLFGIIPVVFDPEHPPPLDLPDVFFTEVTVVQAGQFGGELTIPGMHLYTTRG